MKKIVKSPVPFKQIPPFKAVKTAKPADAKVLAAKKALKK